VAVIEVNDMKKSYGDFEAVKGISFSVEEGEVLAVLGPNGAGKTTTIEILEGYRTRNSGTVSVLGMDPATGGTALRQRIGIVLQDTGIDPYLTVSEILQMHTSYYEHPREVEEVIELVGLVEKAKSRVKQLSGGQQRRLDVALGLIGDPELLFLDEPTTGFDPTARRQAWDVVKNLSTLGKTVLLTTHYMDEAQSLADRVIVIAAGRIVAEGTPESIGGRADADAAIRFRLPLNSTLAEVADAVSSGGTGSTDASSVDDNGFVTISTPEPTAVLHRLTGWAIDGGRELTDLSVSRPSLEDIYLELTGHEEVAE
jgi:ABC-2 type transport system ATP-binding protein